MKKKLFRLAGVALAAAAFAGPASAIPIEAAFNVVGLGTFTADTGNVTNATTITSGSPNIVAAIILNNIGLTTGTALTILPTALPVTVGASFTKEFITSLGTFLENLTVTSVAPSQNALGVVASGTITQTAGAPLFDPTAVYWSAAYTQNTGPGGQINASFNNSTTPPGVVPEPATLALLGLGLAGLGFSRRRKE